MAGSAGRTRIRNTLVIAEVALAVVLLVGAGLFLRSLWRFIQHLIVGGERGIRTLGRVSPTHAFQACSFNHSDISPYL
jgi:hypothetical protein